MKIQIWTAQEMAEIITDAREIRQDPELLVRNDGQTVRPIGIWENMRLDQEDMIRLGRIWA